MFELSVLFTEKDSPNLYRFKVSFHNKLVRNSLRVEKDRNSFFPFVIRE